MGAIQLLLAVTERWRLGVIAPGQTPRGAEGKCVFARDDLERIYKYTHICKHSLRVAVVLLSLAVQHTFVEKHEGF